MVDEKGEKDENEENEEKEEKEEKEENVTGFSSILKTLSEYRELLTVIIFFVGGVLWVFGYFATKDQLKEVKCLMNANMDFIQGQMDSTNLSQILIQNLQEQRRLKSNVSDNGLITIKLTQLEIAAKDIDRKIDKATTIQFAAMNKLKTGLCGDS